MRDTLPSQSNTCESGVLNLDSNSGPGTHWVAYFRKGNRKYYFDSYGADLPVELQRYLGPGKAGNQGILTSAPIIRLNALRPTLHCSHQVACARRII